MRALRSRPVRHGEMCRYIHRVHVDGATEPVVREEPRGVRAQGTVQYVVATDYPGQPMQPALRHVVPVAQGYGPTWGGHYGATMAQPPQFALLPSTYPPHQQYVVMVPQQIPMPMYVQGRQPLFVNGLCA